MTTKIWIWKKVSGLATRFNDVLYARPTSLHSNEFLIYFGGDIQDLQENMVKHPEKKKYTEWSLDNTVRLLSHNFPKYHIFVIRPSRYISLFTIFKLCLNRYLTVKKLILFLLNFYCGISCQDVQCI